MLIESQISEQNSFNGLYEATEGQMYIKVWMRDI